MIRIVSLFILLQFPIQHLFSQTVLDRIEWVSADLSGVDKSLGIALQPIKNNLPIEPCHKSPINDFNFTYASSLELKIFPNPFYDRTTIEINLSTKTNVELMIFNVLGRKIIHLKSETLDKGEHKVIWDGTDETNQKLPEGMYLCKLEAEGKTLIKAIYLAKEN
ncbi:MAG TPA: T9SS type A sorting domain-containing protein [Cytophagaceae bacterium]